VIVAGGAAVYFWLEAAREPSAGPVIVVTPLAPPTTGSPGRTATPLPAPTATPAATSGSGPTPAATPTGAPVSRPITGTVPSGNEALLAAAEMPARDLRGLALRYRPGVTEIPLVVNAIPPSYKVGDTTKFWVSNSDTNAHFQVTAELRYMTDHLCMWVEQGVRFNQRDLEASADRFEKTTYPTNRAFFGSEWTPGVDNDPRLHILHARNLGKNIAGYYSSADQFSRLVNQYSNEREMFYVSADSDNAKPNSAFYDGTLAHEFQHMIHWANDRNEDSWVNEGMAELASYLNGFDPGGADIAYAQQPDTQLTTWSDPAEGNAEHYGASYLFMAYFLERFGEPLTKAVVASPKNGMGGFDDALAQAGRSERFNDIFADWALANYLDRPDATANKRFGYTKIDPPQPKVTETYRRFPASGSAQVSQYGVDYLRLRGSGKLTVNFTGDTQIGLVDATVPGVHAWWSNRGDDGNATLTRAFDLRNVKSATLTFSVWYDIEDGWDYGYVAVSTDGGKRWQPLPGRYSTDKNPVGNAFGVGWTGVSGGGKTPKWVDERVDLTPFAGEEILLRFEYVTDDALNLPGWLVDNIAIPELGYRDDGEAGAGGWQAQGWLLTDNRLAQGWLVQVIEVGRQGVAVQRMQVGADGKGRVTLQSNLNDLTEAVVVISALAPVTTEPAQYSYMIGE
jgi:hypothetical protein